MSETGFDWQKKLAEAKSPEEKAQIFKLIFQRADKELREKGLSDAEREALLEEIMLELSTRDKKEVPRISPEEAVQRWKELQRKIDADLTRAGLSDAEREALVEEILLRGKQKKQ